MDVSTKSHQAKKEKKQKFSILLTHEEIENDIFLMTGGRPSRRPRKRAKTVQKQLDARFFSFPQFLVLVLLVFLHLVMCALLLAESASWYVVVSGNS